MKKQNTIIPTEQRYPELNNLAQAIATTTLIGINQAITHVKSEMPYKAQCVLEMVIKKLEEKV